MTICHKFNIDEYNVHKIHVIQSKFFFAFVFILFPSFAISVIFEKDFHHVVLYIFQLYINTQSHVHLTTNLSFFSQLQNLQYGIILSQSTTPT